MSTRIGTKLLLAGFLVTACGASFLAGQTQPATPPTMPAMEKPIAVINGKEVNNAFFYNVLMQVAGRRVFEQVFDLTLVQTDCQLNDIPIDIGPLDDKNLPKTEAGKDFLKRKEDELTRIKDSIPNPDPTKPLTDEDRTKILNESLGRQGMSPTEFQMNLERAAGLRALAQKIGKIPDPTEEQIKDAWNAQFGEKVQIHIFVLPNGPTTLDIAGKLRGGITTGKGPEQAAKDAGINPPSTGTIPRSAKGPGADELVAAAFALKDKDISQVIDFQSQKIMVYLDKKEPSTLTQNPLEGKLKSKIIEDLKVNNENNWMNARLNKLRSTAVFTINDPELNHQFQVYLAALQAQQAAAASQAATNPTMPTGPVTPSTSLPALPPMGAAPGR